MKDIRIHTKREISKGKKENEQNFSLTLQYQGSLKEDLVFSISPTQITMENNRCIKVKSYPNMNKAFHFSCNKTVTTAFSQYTVTCAAKNKSHVCESVAYFSHNIYIDYFFRVIRNYFALSIYQISHDCDIEYYFDVKYNNYSVTQ